MKNQNSLISLAYIKVNDNPLRVFCHYILYLLLKESSQEMRADQLQEKLLLEFGLNMPHQLIYNCIRILEKQGEVVRLPLGAGYKVAQTSFSVDDFESSRQKLHEQEEKLLNSLIDYVFVHFSKKWTIDEARQYLSTFLDKEGYGAQIFLQKEFSIEGGKASPSIYIGRYVDYLQNNKDKIESKYLEEIVNGIMVLQGIRLTGDYQQSKEQKFKGTVFFLDTKLVLRALGFSWKAQVESVREMVRLLREKYDARIGVFPQTLSEVEKALTSAARALEKHRPVQDLELKLYCELYPEQASLMMDFASNVLGLMKRELGIENVTSMDWNTPSAAQYHINVDRIVDYIEEKCNWRRGTIDYDVRIINQINILRKGDYSKQYGGKEKLPVFVTSNYKLVYTFRDYVIEYSEEDPIWSSHALPVISDNMLLYRIWVPYATEFSRIPALTLARYAYSAQSEGVVFYEKFRERAAEIENTKNVDLINVTEVARKKMEDILLKATEGDLENLTDEVVAVSFEECVRMEHIQLIEENKELSVRRDQRESQVIKLLAEKYVNKLGILQRILLFIARYWWVFAFAIIYATAEFVGESKYLTGISLAPIIIQVVLAIIDKGIDDRGLRFIVYKIALECAKKKYKRKIAKGLRKQGYSSDEEAVVEYCLKNTKVFRPKDK